MRYEPITCKEGRLLRSIVLANPRHLTRSYSGRRVEMELGDHPVADELRRLELGKPVMASFSPDGQAILTAPFESWPVGADYQSPMMVEEAMTAAR